MKYCNRPFDTTKEMDDCILGNINDVVRPEDELFILGDFCFGPVENISNYTRRLPTKNVYLIKGNHDRHSHTCYRENGFSWVKDYYEVRDSISRGKKIALLHYPMDTWNGAFRGSWHLHAHVHTTQADNPKKLRMNVGADLNDFKPVWMADVKSFMEKKTPVFDY